MSRFFVALLAFLAFIEPASAEPFNTPPAQLILAGDFAGAAAQLEADGGLGSLVKACVLRRGLGQSAQAVTDIDRFLATLNTTPAAATAESAGELFLEEVLGERAWPDEAAWESALRSFISALRPHTTSVVRLRAQLQLAEQLWRRSCPIEPTDGACIERIDAYAECRARRSAIWNANKASPLPYDDCLPEPPVYRYVVHPHRPHLAREAQEIVRSVLQSVPLKRRPPPPAGSPLAHVLAHALFLQAEPRFEAALARSIPDWVRESLDPRDPRNPAAVTTFKAFISAQMGKPANHSLTIRDQIFYQQIIKYAAPAGADSRWAVAAAARIAQLAQHLQDQVLGCPLPKPMPAPPDTPPEVWRQAVRNGYCDPADLPWERVIDESLSRCNTEETRQREGDPYGQFCIKLKDKLGPFDLPPTGEIYTPAGQITALPLTSAAVH